jgi:hypothetical protein
VTAPQPVTIDLAKAVILAVSVFAIMLLADRRG